MEWTRENVDTLKESWRDDPCFDLVDDETPEEYKDELSKFDLECRAEWKRKYDQKTKRKIIQISAKTSGEDSNCNCVEIYALCDDGSVWQFFWKTGWEPMDISKVVTSVI